MIGLPISSNHYISASQLSLAAPVCKTQSRFAGNMLHRYVRACRRILDPSGLHGLKSTVFSLKATNAVLKSDSARLMQASLSYPSQLWFAAPVCKTQSRFAGDMLHRYVRAYRRILDPNGLHRDSPKGFRILQFVMPLACFDTELSSDRGV
jgi:hypothetical protein